MKRLLTNARIVNPGGTPALFEHGSIAIEGDTIVAVAEGTIPGDFEEVVDLAGGTVLPGMINAHTHLYSALALGMPGPRKAPSNFLEILERVWWRLDRALDAESTRASFEAGLLTCLRAGVTTVIDHHSSPSFIGGSIGLLVETADAFGVNLSPCYEVTDRNGGDAFDDAVSENLAAIRHYLTHPHIHPLFGLHASFTLSDHSLEKIAREIDGNSDIAIHIHLAEDEKDEEDARKRGYGSATHRLHALGILKPGSLMIHGLHIRPADIDTLKEADVLLVHNPTSNANNRVGTLPGDTIREIPVGLGTDGMQANMLGEAKEGTLIRSSHLSGGEASVDYIRLLFQNNPAIVTRMFGRKIGRLEPGYQADLAVYAYRPRTPMLPENLAGHLLYGLAQPVDVMTRGEFRIRNGRLVGMDEVELMVNARHQAARLWKAMANL